MSRLVFRVHAVQRMFQRMVSEEDIKHILAAGETIEEYPEDSPFPGRLVLGWCDGRPLHVVVADNMESDEVIIVTVYGPDAEAWEADFRRRKK